MKRLVIALALAAAAALPASAQTYTVSQISSISLYNWLYPTWKCVKADGTSCGATELSNPYYKQIVILPSGFADSERPAFWADFDKTVALMTNPNSAGSSWTVQRASQLLFVGYFIPGGPLGDPSATFGGKVAPHPIRGYALSLSQNAVYAQIDSIRYWVIPQLRPIGAAVMFNTFQTPVTANAAPPSLVNKPFGVAKYTRQDLVERGAYVPTHELAHASLNFLDEYVESGFQDLSIKQIDIATPLVLFDGSWGGFVAAISDLLGVYDYNISEILSNNGNDNMATVPGVSTVYSGWPTQWYGYEGGMFFGRGTWHQAGSNLMNGNTVMRGWDDGFAFAHSPSQQQVVDNAFDGGIRRPNDRIRTAGPKNGWPLAFGSETHVMMFDGDKNHHFHPTQAYYVQVGWYDRQWSTCWQWGVIPYPCYNDVWTTAQNWFYPQYRSLSLPMSSLYGLAKLAQQLVCAAGVNEVSSNGGTIRLCDQSVDTMASNFLPTLNFPVPYQDVDVPASQWFTTYWWRFATWNGRTTSGYTGWSSFYRSF